MSAKGRRETTQALGNQGSLRMAWSPGGSRQRCPAAPDKEATLSGGAGVRLAAEKTQPARGTRREGPETLWGRGTRRGRQGACTRRPSRGWRRRSSVDRGRRGRSASRGTDGGPVRWLPHAGDQLVTTKALKAPGEPSARPCGRGQGTRGEDVEVCDPPTPDTPASHERAVAGEARAAEEDRFPGAAGTCTCLRVAGRSLQVLATHLPVGGEGRRRPAHTER